MKTRGIEVHYGYLVHQGITDVPVQFWNRLKSEASKKQLLTDLEADWKTEVEPEHGAGRVYAEHRLFREWVTTLFGEPLAWPWTDGWTPDLVDTYLTQPLREAA